MSATRRSQGCMAMMIAAATLLATPSAWADMVPPPPDNCPSGATGESCHGGEYCRPYTCDDDSSCSGGRVCREEQICVGQYHCPGGIYGGESFPDSFESMCANGSCTAGTCETMKVCVTASDSSSGGTSSGAGNDGAGDQHVDGGCGCVLVGGDRDERTAWWSLLTLSLAIGCRRRHRALDGSRSPSAS